MNERNQRMREIANRLQAPVALNIEVMNRAYESDPDLLDEIVERYKRARYIGVDSTMTGSRMYDYQPTAEEKTAYFAYLNDEMPLDDVRKAFGYKTRSPIYRKLALISVSLSKK